MKSYIHIALAHVLLGVMICASQSANADVVYDWTGTCTLTCTGEATGVLTLNDSYVPGTLMDPTTHFISWSFTSDIHQVDIPEDAPVLSWPITLPETTALNSGGTLSLGGGPARIFFFLSAGAWDFRFAPNNLGGNRAGFGNNGTFTLRSPASPAEKLADLTTTVMEMNLQAGISNALDSKLSNALAALDDANENNDGSALNMLYAFCSSVDAQRGRKLDDSQADTLIGAVNEVIATLDQFAPQCE